MKSKYNEHHIEDCTSVDYELVGARTMMILEARKILTKINNGSDKDVVYNKES